MATAQMENVIRQIRRVVVRKDAAGRSDGQLLASFIDQKDEAAFEALVRRHGPMVFGVCRRLARNYHDAEDAFQATFLVLARKATTVRPRERVVNWLHGVALRTAMKAKTITAKRRQREQQVVEAPELEVDQPNQWRELQPLLDQELNGLPENYRLPILLCDLEGKTIKEATQQLGWPQGSLAGRLARGRKLLAKRLANRGVALSAGSLAAIVSQNAASAAVPTSLMSSTVEAVAMIAAGQAAIAGVVPAKVAILTEGVLKAMLLSKLKIATTILLVTVAIVGVGTVGLFHRTQAGEPSKLAEKKKEVANGDDDFGFPVAPPPLQAFAVANGDQFLLVTMRTEDKDENPPPAKEVEGGKALSSSKTTIYDLNKIQAFDTKWKRIDAKKLPELFKKQTGVLVSADGRPVDPFYLQLVKESTVVLILGPAPKDETPKNEDGKLKSDVDRLDGTWRLISEVNDGTKYESGDVQRWTFNRGTVKATTKSKLSGATSTSYIRIALDETSNPKQIDMVEGTADDLFDVPRWDKRLNKIAEIKVPDGGSVEINNAGARIKGIYSIRDDVLTICVGREKRPTAFESKPETEDILWTFKREDPSDEHKNTDAEQSTPPATDMNDEPVADPAKNKLAKKDKEIIQGTWHLVSAEVDGAAARFAGPPDEDAKRLAVFADDKWTTSFFKGDGFTFKLDPTMKPKTIDLQPLEEAKKTLLGIYELDGDDLKICICTADLIVPGKQERPTALATKQGSNTMLLVLKRQGNKTAKDSPQVLPSPSKGNVPREYVIVAKLMEAGADHPTQIPKMTLEDGQSLPFPLQLEDGPRNLLENVIAVEKIKIGTSFDVRVKRVGGNKVRLFCSFQKNDVEKADVNEIRVLGHSVQSIQDVELHKQVKVVYQKDAKGSAQRWVEITVDELPVAEQAVPAPSAILLQQKVGKK